METKEKETGIFVERQQVSLGIKLAGTFAIVYYGLFFLFMLYLGIFYNTVYDPSYLHDTVNDQNGSAMLVSFITRTVLLGVIIASLIMMFMKKRYGKYIFLICTVILIIFQILTTTPPAWISYIIEALVTLIIAPLKVVKKFNERIIEETHKINVKIKEKGKSEP